MVVHHVPLPLIKQGKMRVELQRCVLFFPHSVNRQMRMRRFGCTKAQFRQKIAFDRIRFIVIVVVVTLTTIHITVLLRF